MMRSLAFAAITAFATAVTTLVLVTASATPAAAQYGDARDGMNDLQRNALKDGCWKRYAGNEHKRYLCLNGEAHWRNALRDGCHQRYSGNGSKLDRCLNFSGLNGGGSYGGGNNYNNHYGNGHQNNYGNNYGGYNDNDLFARALDYGCTTRYQTHEERLRSCLSGNYYSQSAHADGCNRLYSNQGGTYYRCLDSYRPGGVVGYRGNYGGGSYGSNNSYSNSNNYGGNAYGSGGSSGAYNQLSDLQQNALKDGCWQRYSGNERKRYSCLKAESHWRDALRDGCWKRYNGNQGKLDRCLRY